MAPMALRQMVHFNIPSKKYERTHLPPVPSPYGDWEVPKEILSAKSMSSEHYLEHRFRAYQKADKFVKIVNKNYNSKKKPTFDTAVENHMCFVRKVPRKEDQKSLFYSRLPNNPLSDDLYLRSKLNDSYQKLNSRASYSKRETNSSTPKPSAMSSFKHLKKSLSPSKTFLKATKDELKPQKNQIKQLLLSFKEKKTKNSFCNPGIKIQQSFKTRTGFSTFKEKKFRDSPIM